MSNERTIFPFSDETRVRLPLKFLIALLGVVAVCAIAWASTRSDVATHARRLDSVESEQRSQREILIRIDERTAEMKRQMDRSTR